MKSNRKTISTNVRGKIIGHKLSLSRGFEETLIGGARSICPICGAHNEKSAEICTFCCTETVKLGGENG